MPVVLSSSTRNADALINYALEDKPGQTGERYVMASGAGGLLVSVAKQQMRDVRKRWNKDGQGAFVQAYHVIESFAQDELDPDDPDAWMTAQKLGHALAEERFPGRQVLVVTQRDGKSGCVHNHLVVNSVDTRTGRSLDSSLVMHARLVEAHERVLEAQGFEQRADLKQAFSDATDRRERGERSGLRRADSTQQSELREFQRYILWEVENEVADDFSAPPKPEPFSLTILKSRIEQALSDPTATDWAGFVAAGRVYGVDIEQRGKKGRGISYGMLREQPDGSRAEPSPSDRRRCSTLGTGFEMDAAEQAFATKRLALSVPTQPAPIPVSGARRIANLPEPLMSTQAERTQRLFDAMEGLHEEAEAISDRLIAAHLAANPPKIRHKSPEETMSQPKQLEPREVDPEPVGHSAPAMPEPHPSTTHVDEDPSPTSPALQVEERPVAHAISQPTDENAKASLLKINARLDRMGLPKITAEEHAANRAMTPEERSRKRKREALSSDIEESAEDEYDL